MTKTSLKSRSQKFIAFTAFAALFTYAVVFTVPQASVNELGRDFHVSNTSLGLLFRLFMIGFLIAAVVGGRLSDKYGKLPMVVLGCAMMAAGMLMFSQAHSFEILRFAAVIGGIGGGLAEVVAMAVISDIYHGSVRTVMMNWAQVIFSVGAFTQPLFFAKMLSLGVNWRRGYLAAALISILCTVIAARASKFSITVIAARASKFSINVQEEEYHDQVSWRSIIKNRLVLQLALGMMLYVGSELGFASWVAVYLEKYLKSSAPLAASSVAMFWAGVGIGRLAATHIAKRFSDSVIICSAFSLATIFGLMLLMVNEPKMALLMILCVGFSLGPVWPTIISRAGGAFPAQSGTVIGIVAACGCIGGAIVPSVVGSISDIYDIRIALGIPCISLILGLITMIFSEKHAK